MRELPEDQYPAIVGCCLCDSALYAGEKTEVVTSRGHQALAHSHCVDKAFEEKDDDEEEEEEDQEEEE